MAEVALVEAMLIRQHMVEVLDLKVKSRSEVGLVSGVW